MKLAFVCIALCVVIQTISAADYYRSRQYPPAPHYPTCNKCQKRVQFGSYGHFGYKCVAITCGKPCGPCGTCKCNLNTGLQYCDCRGDYSGKLCRRNPCKSNYCANGGTCVANTKTCRVSCQCTKCWTGPRCRKSVSCSLKCGRCGRCVCDNRRGQYCRCRTGWSGNRCQIGPCDKSKNTCPTIKYRRQQCKQQGYGCGYTCVPYFTHPGGY